MRWDKRTILLLSQPKPIQFMISVHIIQQERNRRIQFYNVIEILLAADQTGRLPDHATSSLLDFFKLFKGKVVCVCSSVVDALELHNNRVADGTRLVGCSHRSHLVVPIAFWALDADIASSLNFVQFSRSAGGEIGGGKGGS